VVSASKADAEVAVVAAEEMAAELRTVRPTMARTGTTTAAEPLKEPAPETHVAHAGMITAARHLEVEEKARITVATAKDAVGTATTPPEHGWNDCPLRRRHEAEDSKEHRCTEQAHATQDSVTQTWFTRGVATNDELEGFAIVFDDDTRGSKTPASALPAERTTVGDQGQDAPVTSLQDNIVIYDPQVLQAHVAELPEEGVEGVAGDGPAERLAGDQHTHEGDYRVGSYCRHDTLRRYGSVEPHGRRGISHVKTCFNFPWTALFASSARAERPPQPRKAP